ncbi:hypothetical protein [Clavibacter tessellarius]|uniref:hypothetical protein n=1 Tax=Clavibacter tessellarius TaxID=31965 RepID=UPI0039E7DBCF
MDDDDRRAEIAQLRRRVFGPDAEPGDAASLARLRELEGRDAGMADAPDDARADDARTPTRRDRPGRRIRPRRVAAWAASLLVAAVVGAGATAWWLGDGRGTVAVLALEPPPTPDNATYLSVDTGSIAPGSLFAAFHGISVARVPVPDAVTGVDATCLLAGPAEQDGSVGGLPGCATGAVPARTALVVTADQPQELRDAFPLGTTLTFELEGDGETVRVRTAGG